MPELPEVETVRRVLEDKVVGRIIKDVKVLCRRIVQDDLDYFVNTLKGKTIEGMGRKGKYLYFILNDDIYLVSHLRMEGKYFIKEEQEELNKHEHVIFYLDDNLTLRYHDVRKFGTMEIKTKDSLFTTHPLVDLGPDGTALDVKYLDKVLRKDKPIKEVLLDQSIIAGIGNIYADEILAKSKIHPLRHGKDLTDKDIINIKEACEKTLKEAINDGGTTIRSYTSQLGVTGRFQQHLVVHTMAKCGCCGENIIKIRVGGRGTYYCPNCQK